MSAHDSVSGRLDAFIPAPDARERYEVTVRAPADVTFSTCADFDMQSLPLVRAVFWLRTTLLRSSEPPGWDSRGFLADMKAMGWGPLIDDPPRLFVAGASCQPWLPDVVFSPRTAEDFRSFAEPNQVKIAWTLQVEQRGQDRCSLATETRAQATDAQARKAFSRYWRWARFGILPLRWMLLPAVRREAESAHRVSGGST